MMEAYPKTPPVINSPEDWWQTLAAFMFWAKPWLDPDIFSALEENRRDKDWRQAGNWCHKIWADLPDRRPMPAGFGQLCDCCSEQWVFDEEGTI